MKRKSLVNKIEEHDKALSGRGVVIDEAQGYIYRLAVAPDGWCRVSQNHFNVQENTVLGQPKNTFDFETPSEAIAVFETFKNFAACVWRKDERVMYAREDDWNASKYWKDGRTRHVLLVDGMEAFVLYCYENREWYVRAYIDGGCQESTIITRELTAAKEEAEKWYANILTKSIATHEASIKSHQKQLMVLERIELVF